MFPSYWWEGFSLEKNTKHLKKHQFCISFHFSPLTRVFGELPTHKIGALEHGCLQQREGLVFVLGPNAAGGKGSSQQQAIVRCTQHCAWCDLHRDSHLFQGLRQPF